MLLVLCPTPPGPDTPACCPSGLSTEGIYRVSGNKSEMESLQRQFDQGKAAGRQRLEPVEVTATAEPPVEPLGGGCSVALGCFCHSQPQVLAR